MKNKLSLKRNVVMINKVLEASPDTSTQTLDTITENVQLKKHIYYNPAATNPKTCHTLVEREQEKFAKNQ